ncbi:hypothetical protein V8G54_028811 [Vigna mungo]|uniref:Integrase catalytic domain-containing protein n=1 Tax=Vigna mungo TaxID=3915 RepID=A0AAQ3MTE0_VIGMU
MVVIDRLSKFGHFIPLKTDYNSKTMTDAFINNVAKIHGFPRTIVSDRDRIFISSFWQHLFKAQGTTLAMSSAYHPQSNGQTEILNKTLEIPKLWFSMLPWAQYWYNSSYHHSIKMSPFKVVFGREPPAVIPYEVNVNDPPTVQDSLLIRNTLQQQLKQNLMRAQNYMKMQADKKRRELQNIGDLALVKLQLYRQNSVTLRKNEKLSMLIEKIGTMAYKLKPPPTARIHPVFHISLLKKFVGNPSPPYLPLPLTTNEFGPVLSPLKVLDTRILQHNSKDIPQDLNEFQNAYPHFNLEDRVACHGEGIVTNKETPAQNGRRCLNRKAESVEELEGKTTVSKGHVEEEKMRKDMCKRKNPKSGGLVDYDYDEDDEDYRPPPKNNPEASEEYEGTMKSLRLKRKLTKVEILQMPKLSKTSKSKDRVFSALCSTLSQAVLPRKKPLVNFITVPCIEDNQEKEQHVSGSCCENSSVSAELNHLEKETTAFRNSSNRLYDTSDNGQLDGEEHTMVSPKSPPETLRLYPVAPLLVPRECREDVTIDGYCIKKKSRVIVNAWALGRDSKVWSDNAEEFCPERFSNSNVDIKGFDFRLIPFGSGRRGCLGIHLGLTTAKIVLAQLVHCFNWELPLGMSPDELDMTEKFGLTMPRSKHLLAVPTYRLADEIGKQ